MANRSNKKNKNRNARNKDRNNSRGSTPQTQEPGRTAEPAGGQGIPLLAFWIGLALLLVAAGASLMLVYSDYADATPPGCGFGSGCDALSSSVWGKIPGLGWPLANVGLAYFISLAMAWLVLQKIGLTNAFRWVVQVGVAISVLLIGVMFFRQQFCSYCAAAHIANIAFLVVMELMVPTNTTAESATTRSAGAFAGFFLGVTIILSVVHIQDVRTQQAEADTQARESTERIIDSSTRRGSDNGDSTTNGEESGSAENTNVENAGTASTTDAFTGRWHLGPNPAPIRLVVISDYQCVDCNRVEEEIRQIMEERDDVLLSAKHFPFSNQCNPYLNRDQHPNACWAARAAEAAGILRGNDGFWEMHNWLFDRGGGFTRDELIAGLRELGYNPNEFISLMSSDEALRPVQEDIEEAYNLGLRFTPMIFINGEQFHGWHREGNLTRAIEQIAAANPKALTPEEAGDHPVTGEEKFVNDFLRSPSRPVAADLSQWSLGEEGTPVLEIVIWGDYQEPNTAQADAIIRDELTRRPSMRYTFRHYPFDNKCNAAIQTERFEYGCFASRAAEAAGQLGGSDAYWEMHRWLFANQDQVDPDTVTAQAETMGLDPQQFMAAITSDDVDAAVQDDIGAGRRRGLRGIPHISINGRHAQFWQHKNEPRLDLLLDAAVEDLE